MAAVAVAVVVAVAVAVVVAITSVQAAVCRVGHGKAAKGSGDKSDHCICILSHCTPHTRM